MQKLNEDFAYMIKMKSVLYSIDIDVSLYQVNDGKIGVYSSISFHDIVEPPNALEKLLNISHTSKLNRAKNRLLKQAQKYARKKSETLNVLRKF
jgi:hypothetical protein